jgi:hypothetical protein
VATVVRVCVALCFFPFISWDRVSCRLCQLVFSRLLAHSIDVCAALYRYAVEPSESEKEEMDRLEQDATGEGGVTSRDGSGGGDAVAALQQAAAKLLATNWTLTSKQGLRAATDDLIKILRSSSSEFPTVDIPADDVAAKQRIGPLLVRHRDLSAADMIPIIVNEFGFAQDKKEKAAKREAAVSASLKNPANGPLVAALQELAELYFKEGSYLHGFMQLDKSSLCVCGSV